MFLICCCCMVSTFQLFVPIYGSPNLLVDMVGASRKKFFLFQKLLWPCSTENKVFFLKKKHNSTCFVVYDVRRLDLLKSSYFKVSFCMFILKLQNIYAEKFKKFHDDLNNNPSSCFFYYCTTLPIIRTLSIGI